MRPFFVSMSVLFWSLPAGVRANDAEQDKLFKKVMDRLLSADLVRKEYPAKFAWPPKCYVKRDSANEVNAYATASKEFGAAFDKGEGKIRPVVMVTGGMLDKVIKGDEHSLAVIMGHELAHLSKEHVLGRTGETELLMLAFGRDQEIEADLSGLRYAMAAGYPYRSGVANAFKQMQGATKATSFEGLSGTHPTWEERLAILDRDQSKLWQAMSAFHNGALFLELEQYQAAQQCYKAVTFEFPDCHEAWSNLGYAQLMQYCDGLDSDDVRRFGIGQIVTGGFYQRPASLDAKVRGVDEKLWKDAVKASQRALSLKGDLVLPRVNLGLAFLVHPEGKNAKESVRWFNEALDLLDKDKGLQNNTPAVIAVLANSGVADLAAGDVTGTATKFESVQRLLANVHGPSARSIADAWLYNMSLLEERAKDPTRKNRAGSLLRDYLKTASPDSAWWPIAYERYAKLAKELNVDAATQEELKKRRLPDAMRLATSVKVGKTVLTLSEAVGPAVERLGGVESPLFPKSKMSRWRFAEHGIDLLAKDKIVAILLTNTKSPPVVLRASGAATKGRELRVGMTEKEATELLKDQHAASGRFAIAAKDDAYRFYPELGLALRFEKGLVDEVAIAQIPRHLYAEE